MEADKALVERLRSHDRFWARVQRFVEYGEVHQACSKHQEMYDGEHDLCFRHDAVTCKLRNMDMDPVTKCPGCLEPANSTAQQSTRLTRLMPSTNVLHQSVVIANEDWPATLEADGCSLRIAYPCTDCHQKLQVFAIVD